MLVVSGYLLLWLPFPSVTGNKRPLNRFDIRARFQLGSGGGAWDGLSGVGLLLPNDQVTR